MSEQPKADEHEEPQEPRINPAEPEMDLSEAEGFPVNEPTGAPYNEPPPFVHTPESVYVYDDHGTGPTQHTVLGRIKPGENRFETDEPVMVAALEACCAEGLLRQVTPGSKPSADDEDKQSEDTSV